MAKDAFAGENEVPLLLSNPWLRNGILSPATFYADLGLHIQQAIVGEGF